MNPRQSIAPTFTLRRGLAVGIAAFSSLLLLALGAWTWLLRDGLGPDSIESSGIEALRRFFSDFWPFALLGLVLFVIAFIIGRHQSPAPNASANATGNA
jgi:hypothetical protein